MSIRKNTLDLDSHYDLTKSGQNDYVGSTPLFSWGYGANGQLGQNTTTQFSSPVQIPGTSWSSISAGGHHALATKTDNTLWSWGHNSVGQLGQNTTTYFSSPVQIPGTTWSAISAGSRYTSLATKTDGTLWSWGQNQYGQLGQNATTNVSSPIQIPGTTWSSISGGGHSRFSLATKTDGTLWAWGGNSVGQLGQNITTDVSSPVQIPGTTWSSISGGNNHSLATKTDGTLWAWGGNSSGQLGQNNITQSSSPVQIPGTSWSLFSAGYNFSLATKTDNTLWSWGGNNYGNLGLNDTARRSSPVQIPGTSWSTTSGSISPSGSAAYHAFATKTDGTLWSWGRNTTGQLGQNDRIARSSPIQIPGTSWSAIDSGGYNWALATQNV
jgi:alpha-tubulin suppressor-like RCC1 family protein